LNKRRHDGRIALSAHRTTAGGAIIRSRKRQEMLIALGKDVWRTLSVEGA
jgi:hypothetical protein